MLKLRSLPSTGQGVISKPGLGDGTEEAAELRRKHRQSSYAFQLAKFKEEELLAQKLPPRILLPTLKRSESGWLEKPNHGRLR